MNKKVISIALFVVFLAVVGFVKMTDNKGPNVGGQFFYSSPTSAETTVGIYTHATVLATSTSRSLAIICNNSIVSNDAVYLQFGATSTIPSGYRLPSGECYTMTPEDGNLFTGLVYGLASTSTTTVLTVTQNQPN